MPEPLRIATRGSRLALWQAEWVRGLLRDRGVASELVVVETRGDTDAERSLQTIEGKGFFTKEIEEALLEAQADIAVHSLKDLPTQLPPGLVIGAVPRRGDPRDCLVGALPQGARVGTSSLRRAAQIKLLRPDVTPVPIRGNVPTRLGKAAAGREYDAVVLALAGLERLGFGARASTVFDPREFVPAPGQGAIAVEIRADDHETEAVVRAVDDAATRAAVTAERALLAALEGGCRAPIAAYAGPDLQLTGRVVAVDGSAAVDARMSVDPHDPAAAGHAVAKELRRRGAEQLIHDARAAS